MSLTRDAIAQRLRVGSSDLASQDTSQTVSDTIKLKVRVGFLGAHQRGNVMVLSVDSLVVLAMQ